MGKKVPEVLMNGNHKLIKEWRLNESIKRTKETLFVSGDILLNMMRR